MIKTIITIIAAINAYFSPMLGISTEEFQNAGFSFGDTVDVIFENGEELINIPYYSGYYCERGENLIVSYPGNYEPAIATNYGKLAEELDLKPGMSVEIRMNTPGAMRTIEELNHLIYTNEREDYESDEIFANFRSISVGKLGSGRLYRSASPFDNKFNRAGYVSDLVEKAGIQTILALSEDEETMASEKEGFSDFANNMYDQGNVILSKMAVNYQSDDFSKTMVEGFRELSKRNGPYLIHCQEGKDRTGFVCAVLEALMGASYEEIVDDYMLTYRNYYGIVQENEPERYDTLVSRNIDQMLFYITELGSVDELKTNDLEELTGAYLERLGMTPEEINALKQALS